MPTFEEVGVDLQRDSVNAAEANRRFERSCELCSTRGIRLKCDNCGISRAHEEIIEFFKDFKSLET